MKKFYLFSAGLLMATAPLFAQIEVPDGPTRTDQDAKVIFEQGFEQDWDAWSSEVVDKIETLYYYAHTGDSGKTSISSDWTEIIERTDSVLELKNGVLQTDLAADEGAFYNDKYTIFTDQNTDRLEELKKFGIDPGTHYFSYVSDVKLLNTGNAYSSGVVENYRRNLFVRGLPIDDHSSYRLTMYIKVNNSSESVTPTFYADVMRGYFHSEKPFTTGDNQFEYKQTSFTGNWEKVTFMTYYINDSIQDVLYNKQYWWAGNEWGWRPEGSDGPMYFIKQPDKYFVRLSFASDSTEFLVDNISLTKSWIGGVEYWGDKIRVDFGYKTNLKDLAKAAYEKTNIDAVQLPGQYFSVLGYYNPASHGEEGEGMWYEIPINSAEYHGDGYMYMWTAEDEEGETFKFDYYDEILVNFTNPVDDKDLCLVYTDSKLYPMADDTTWAKTKEVPNFYNEVAKPNQFVFDNVYSMMDRPPVFQGAPFENGSFGLDGTIRELNIKFSKKIEFDPNATEQSELAWCRVTGPTGKEIWTVKEATDSSALFVRPADKTEPLKGTYNFRFMYLKGKTTDYSEPFELNYEFGPFDKYPNADPIFATDWRKDGQENQNVPAGFSIWDKSDGYKVGDGSKLGSSGTKARVYYTNPAKSGGLDCGFYVSSRGQKQGGHIYYGTEENFALTLAAGTYTIAFNAANWDGYEVPITLYIYPKSAFVLNGTPATPDAARKAFATFTPTKKASSSNIQIYDDPYGEWESDSYAFDFTVDAADDYVLEFETAMGESGNAQSYGGMLMSNFTITKSLGLSFGSVSAFNKAMDNAKAQIKAAEEVKFDIKPYVGEYYESFKALVASYEGWEDTAPSAYANTVAIIEKATKDMKARMEIVDSYFKTYDDAAAKIAEYDTEVELQGLAAFKTLSDMYAIYATFNPAEVTDDQLNLTIEDFKAAIKALDDRKAMNDKWDAKVLEIEALINDSVAQKSLPQYGEMVTAYEDALNADVITPDNDAFQSMYDALCGAKNGYVFKVDYIAAKTRQAKDLAALAVKLGYEIPADVQDLLDCLYDEDANLEKLLRDAAILQIYKNFAQGNDLVDEDVSALVPNYFLYNEADLERDMEKNSSGYWRIKNNVTSTTAFPHWSITPTTGNWYPSKEKAVQGTTNVGRLDWETEGHIFDGGVRCAPTTQGTLTSTVDDLPAAYYWVGFYGYNQTSNFFFSAVGDETSYNPGLSTATGKFTYKEFGADSIKTVSKITYTIKQNSSSSSEADIRYFILKLRGMSEDVVYAEQIAAQEEKVNADITFVAPASEEMNTKFYNLNGMEIAPKAGQLMIRQTIRKDGTVANEKVLVK